MNNKALQQMIEELSLNEKIELESIPNLDLYMDQVITLFENTLGHTKRYDSDKLLTKTMINNYTKDKLLMPAVKKKYTKEHVLLMILLYELKQILTIGDIKSLFSTIVNQDQVDAHLLEGIYQVYLDSKTIYSTSFKEETMSIESYVNEEIHKFSFDKEVISSEKLGNMLKVILLTEKANYYKRLAEKIIDEELNTKKISKQ